MGLNVGQLRAFEARYWRTTPFTLQRPTATQTDTGEWVQSFATVASGLCMMQNKVDDQVVLGPSGEPQTVIRSLCHLPPATVVHPQDQLIVNGITYQVRTLRNADDDHRASLVVEVERLAT